MISGVFSSFDDAMELKGKFEKIFTFKHEVESQPVEGVIQLDKNMPEFKIGKKLILNCELIDYVQVGRNTREKDKDGRYYIKITHTLVPRLFKFQIIDKKFVRISELRERQIVSEGLTIALGGTKNRVTPIRFDMKELEKHYPVHKKSNVKREGFWKVEH